MQVAYNIMFYKWQRWNVKEAIEENVWRCIHNRIHPYNTFHSQSERDNVLLWRVFSVTSSFYFVRLLSTLFSTTHSSHCITSQNYRDIYRYMHTYIATIQWLNRWQVAFLKNKNVQRNLGQKCDLFTPETPFLNKLKTILYTKHNRTTKPK